MPKGKSHTLGTGKEALLLSPDAASSKGIAHAPMESARLQETLHTRIQGALGQLSQATQLLNESPELEYTAQIDTLLEDIVRQQNEIKVQHGVLADINGDMSETVQLGIQEGVTRTATQRFDGQDENKRVFYERTIQTLEQQLQEFQRHLHDGNSGGYGLLNELDSDSEEEEDDESEVDLEENRDDAVVAEYVHRCREPSRAELIEEDKTFELFFRRRHFDVLGCFFFLFFIAVAIGYAFVRIRFSIAPLNTLAWYGAVVFGIEMLGAISIIFYGVWLIATPNNSDIVGLDSASALRRQYHIRVLVPCYGEPLAIVQRTVLAARRAIVPEGCQVTIYLCDDGKKADKRKFVESLAASAGPTVIYITGRKRNAGKTLNGKSENLNHCLKLIYPEDRGEDELPNIPLTEVMCLFDADQSCSRRFFTALMPYIDSGDNVAVALSPQLMFNVSPNVDIFNHQNVHFWEKMQPGMDALGFISLTGTNMILRCRALQDCGWFPTESVTEDWELGMRMKKWGWACRYVQQYNAIGEAPDEVRQCFQQRSRWCKGHFQTFWSDQCPLIDLRLGPFYQLTYSSTCLSYISAALAVPAMTLVPIITLLFGYFPIALNLPTVTAITIYYIALHALTYYSKSWRELRALWLANIGTTIMFWPYAKAALFTPFKQLMGKGLTFKATSKGSQKQAVTLKEIGPSLLLVLLSIAALIAGLTNFDVNVNAPKSIALMWVVYNLVPHALLLIYARFGSGRVLHIAADVLFVVQSFVSILALVLLWVLFPREEDYPRAATLSLRFLQAEWSGINVPAGISWRRASGEYNLLDVNFTRSDPLDVSIVNVTSERVDLSGGFYTEGEIGPVKVTTHVALTTAMLSWSMLDFADWWAADAERLADGLELVRHGMEYVDACYIPAPPINVTAIAGLSEAPFTPDDIMVFAVGDVAKERTRWKRPEDPPRIPKISTTTAASVPADLAGQMVAGMAAGSLALARHGVIEAPAVEANLARAHRLFTSVMLAPQLLTEDVNATDAPLFESYPSNSYIDDLFWASTWLLRASNLGFRAANASFYYEAARKTFELALAERDSMAVSPDYMNNVALVHAAVTTFDWSFHSAAQSWIWDWICSGTVDYTTFGRAWHPESIMLGDTAMAAAIAATYVHAARSWDKASANEEFMTGFHCFAEGQGRFMLGVNFRKPTLTSYNDRDYKRLFHRGASCPEYPTPCEPSAATSGAEDKQDLAGALLWLPGFRDSADDVRGRGTGAENATVVALDNNAAVPLLFAALADRQRTHSYFDCLQGQGSQILEHPVCRHPRPLSTRLGPDNVPVAERPERFRGLWSESDSIVQPAPPAPDSLLNTTEAGLAEDGTAAAAEATADSGSLLG